MPVDIPRAEAQEQQTVLNPKTVIDEFKQKMGERGIQVEVCAKGEISEGFLKTLRVNKETVGEIIYRYDKKTSALSVSSFAVNPLKRNSGLGRLLFAHILLEYQPVDTIIYDLSDRASTINMLMYTNAKLEGNTHMDALKVTSAYRFLKLFGYDKLQNDEQTRLVVTKLDIL